MNPNNFEWARRISNFEVAAHGILSQHESSKISRVVKVEETYSKLSILNLQQDDLFKQALRCIESGLYAAAHVMCWAACMDFIQQKLDETGMATIRSLYPAWPRASNATELAEHVPERQLVEALRKIGIATKNDVKALVSLLDRRNECAHPTGYHPGLNEALGYISECLARIQKIA